jgi:phosphoketolase
VSTPASSEALSRKPNVQAIQTYRQRNPLAHEWAEGYRRIQHTLETQDRVFGLADAFAQRNIDAPLFQVLIAADRVASAALWLVVHATYARRARLDGGPLSSEDFKPEPQGHTGGALNMVPAYVGYMAANAIAGLTRAWLMGQGHCVAAIDAVNLLLSNMSHAHAERYSYSDAGLARYLSDFYSYRIAENGGQDSPLGSHVNAHTAGGLGEGGYLGFAELQYVHMPLRGERLVAFLSDGAFEEQRGGNWAPRWWRAEDCGVVTPILINNGRRIDQRTTVAQRGGVDWLIEYQRLNGFDPFVFDGRDPAAFVWAIFEAEFRLEAAVEQVRGGVARYPVPLPYGIAIAPKGAGFFNEGTNLAHNLPLGSNPARDPAAADHFNKHARPLWVPTDELQQMVMRFQTYQASGRPREREHPLAQRDVRLRSRPEMIPREIPTSRADPESWTRHSPMLALDEMFVTIVEANPHLRPRVGNPDEMRSNRLVKTLERLRFRVTDPEPGIPEDCWGAVITALNEEAVACAALGNKGGINLIATYEAFALKMQGALRQEITFAFQCQQAGRPARWLSVPLILTSHTWENGKNEFSHQDPVMAEVMMNEIAGISRVLFVPDSNTALAALREVYLTQGEIWTMVVPKSSAVADLFSGQEATRLLERGGLRLTWAGHRTTEARLVITAIGSYQLEQALIASQRLAQRDIPHSVNYLLEPVRVAQDGANRPRDGVAAELFPPRASARLFLTHTRPSPMRGILQHFDTGSDTEVLGFINRGGTLDSNGMLFVNRCSWAHAVAAGARLLGLGLHQLLSAGEHQALQGQIAPQGQLF